MKKKPKTIALKTAPKKMAIMRVEIIGIDPLVVNNLRDKEHSNG